MKELLKRYKYTMLIVFIPYILFILLLVIPTKKSVTLPGDVKDINKSIIVNNGYNQSGSFNSIFVNSSENLTLFQLTFCQNSNESYIYDYDPSYNLEEADILNRINKDASIINSIICAYESANLEIDYKFKGIVVTDVEEFSSFKVGDIILGESRSEILNDLQKSKSQLTDIKIIRSKSRSKEEISIRPNIVNESFGITLLNRSYYDIYEINNLNDIKILTQTTGGPSGGLLQSLSVYNSLTEFDYSRGKKIAGTGTIDIFGNVGVIGGIKQKVYTAAKANCDIFFSPDGPEESYEHQNFLDAAEVIKDANKKYGSNMKLIPVKTIIEALEYLKTI